jgi:hypothetical protein
MSPNRERAMARAQETQARHASSRVREECLAGCHLHVDVFNNSGELLETIHFPYPKP